MAIDYNDNDFIYDTHWLSMKRAIAGNGILTGMETTENGVPDMDVLVAAGTYRSANVTRTYAGGTITCDPADLVDDRWDLISGGPAGLTYTAGTPGVIQVPPDLPSIDDIIIALIKVPANDTAITDAQIYYFGFTVRDPIHAASHLPGAADALTTGVPSDIGTANAEGSAAAFARQDHIHNIPALGITTARINDLAVSTGKIALLAVTEAQIANGTIPHGKINVANIDGAAGTPSMRTIGTGAAQACAGNDSRLSDSRTPISHGASLHTDRVRRIPFDICAGYRYGVGTPDCGIYSNALGLLCDPAVGTGMHCVEARIPNDCVQGLAMNVYVEYMTFGGAADITGFEIAAYVTVTKHNTANVSTLLTPTLTFIKDKTTTTAALMGAFTPAAGSNGIQIRFNRQGVTFTGTIFVTALWVEYNADM